MSMEYVLLEDGRRFSLDELRSRYSLSIFQVEHFYAVCEFMAAREALSPIEHKALVNLYALKSSRIRNLAALAYFLQTEADSCKRVAVHEDGIEILQAFVPEQSHERVSLGPWRASYITRPTVLFIVFKVVLHRLFRLFDRASGPSRSMVRGWVDVTASMYGQEMADSRVRLYPFPYGVLRQWRFLRDCRRRGLDVALSGLPYGALKVLRMLLSWQPSARLVVAAEVQAYQRYASELLAQGVKRVYTSDEFEIAAVALYQTLLAQGVSVVNTAHGVGFYAPYVAYSEFRGVNFAQADFYRLRCPSLQPKVRAGKNTRLGLGTVDEVRELPPSIVLIDQNFADFHCMAEAQALSRIRESLERLSVDCAVPLFVKVHPNSKDEQFERPGQAILARTWEMLAGFRPIFVTVNSTAWYDVQGYGPVLVCDERSFFPEIYFGSDLERFRLEDLESRVQPLFDPARWYDAAKCHERRGGAQS